VTAQARESLAIAQHLGPGVAGAASAAFTDGLQRALLVAVLVLLVAAVLVLVIGWRVRGTAGPEPQS
jgi:hypothetical protein